MVHSTHFEISTSTVTGRRHSYPQEDHHPLYVPSYSGYQLSLNAPSSPSSFYLDEYAKPEMIQRAVSYNDEEMPSIQNTNEIHRLGRYRHQQQMMYHHRPSVVDRLGLPDLSSSIIPDEPEQAESTHQPQWMIQRSMAFSEDTMDEETSDYSSKSNEVYDHERYYSILDDDEDSLDEYIETSTSLYLEDSILHSSHDNSSGYIVTPTSW